MNSSLNPLCTDIEALLLSGTYSLVQFVQMCLLLVTLLSIVVLIRKVNRHRIIVHGNLLLLFSNIIAVYFLHSLGQIACIIRYKLLLLFYKDPCELLTPIWMVCLFYGPTYLYYVAYPGFHFCVMVERVRATCLAEKYEREGQGLGLAMAIVNWFLSLGFMAFVICSAVADTALFGQPQGIIFLTSNLNNLPIFYLSNFTLFLTILTALCDWRVTRLNSRIRIASLNYGSYSLSRNFQLNENALAMRLILPLDTAYALLYSVYTLVLILLRAYRSALGNSNFSYFYNLANTLLFLYSALTMLVYIRFVEFVIRCQRRNVSQQRASQPEAKIYFRQLEEQWGAGA